MLIITFMPSVFEVVLPTIHILGKQSIQYPR